MGNPEQNVGMSPSIDTRQAHFGEAARTGTTHAMAGAALTRGERSKREEDQGSPTLCPDARQPQEMHVDPCWEQRTRLIGFCSYKCRGRAQERGPAEGKGGSKQKLSLCYHLLLIPFKSL